MAFPDVPWIFVFRDTVEILQSHLKQGSNAVPKVCTRSYRLPEEQQPVTTLKAIRDAGASLSDLDHVQYCAAHLAGLSLAALNEHDRGTRNGNETKQKQKQKTGTARSKDKGNGRFVEYTQLPERLWEEILPDHFGLGPLSQNDMEHLQLVSGVYSKGRGSKRKQEWAEDSTEKQETASQEVTDAANRFAGKIYQRMNQLALSSSSS
eukprot:CAMPEP_0172364576 /NCGR_PEP_ID=MMETSP1060-20121228/7661_1 /TAXON_ID=37318 /ORGANISM="Pseudo-nitzschia pungens, Strain cf. cingulata" /LENGTH=206 /DNA_ID=CAMNT_0013087607 /DNA_START=8 /DNA_END=631 /DNA_ORIENTATION=+